MALTSKEAATAEALRAEYERLEQAHADADELSEEIDQRLGEIETALAAFDERPVKYDAAEVARAGAFVSIQAQGNFAWSAVMCGPKMNPDPGTRASGRHDGIGYGRSRVRSEP